jgi:von Willebrand factor type A domain
MKFERILILRTLLIFSVVIVLFGCKNEPTAPEGDSSITPNSPSPSDGATISSSTLELAWKCQSSSFSIYFGESSPPSRVDYAYREKIYHLDNLKPNTTYYWKVYNQENSVEGPIWKFTTGTIPGYSINKYLVQTENPSYLNIMFQVVDMAGNGITTLDKTSFTILEDNYQVSPTESAMNIKKQDVLPYTLKTVLMIDNSNSVGANLQDIKNAALSLIDGKLPQQQIAIYTFSDHTELLQDFTISVSNLKNAINSISLGFPTTDLYGAVINGVSRWEDTYTTTYIEQGFLVILTDGSDTQGRNTLAQALSARGEKRIYTVGLGTEIDKSVLTQIGNSGSYAIDSASSLKDKFIEIQSKISLWANSFYWLYYLSPKRGNITHSLTLSINNNANTATTATLNESFSSGSFYSLRAGVYINSNIDNPTGLDSLSISINSNYSVNAISVLGSNPKKISWQSSNASYATITPDTANTSIAVIKAKMRTVSPISIIVTDLNNNYVKTIPLRVN